MERLKNKWICADCGALNDCDDTTCWCCGGGKRFDDDKQEKGE
jgi:ribosomal protein L40E